MPRRISILGIAEARVLSKPRLADDGGMEEPNQPCFLLISGFLDHFQVKKSIGVALHQHNCVSRICFSEDGDASWAGRFVRPMSLFSRLGRF